MTVVFSSGMSFGSFYFLGIVSLGFGEISSKHNGPPSNCITSPYEILLEDGRA